MFVLTLDEMNSIMGRLEELKSVCTEKIDMVKYAYGCRSSCSGSCDYTCDGSCGGSCGSSCSSDCSYGCKHTCDGNCKDTCAYSDYHTPTW